MPKGGRIVAVVDDACTSGASLFHAIKRGRGRGRQRGQGVLHPGPQRGRQRGTAPPRLRLRRAAGGQREGRDLRPSMAERLLLWQANALYNRERVIPRECGAASFHVNGNYSSNSVSAHPRVMASGSGAIEQRRMSACQAVAILAAEPLSGRPTARPQSVSHENSVGTTRRDRRQRRGPAAGPRRRGACRPMAPTRPSGCTAASRPRACAPRTSTPARCFAPPRPRASSPARGMSP